jgi:DNA (cytosine-5)-methyltransferase 1
MFCGAGGLDLGFKQLGFDLVYACDSDAAAVDCYSRNIDKRVFLRDARGNEFRREIAALGGCNVVLGGFPCQGFSKAGPKQADDDRNPLYREMLKAVEALRPVIFIGENVDGLSQNFAGVFLDRILSDFTGLGYSVEQRLLDAVCFGLPQYRRRIFFVGVRAGSGRHFEWPVPTHLAAVRNGDFKVDYAPTLWDACDVPMLQPRTIRDAIHDLVQISPVVPDHIIEQSWPASYDLIFPHVKRGQKLCNVRHADSSVYTWEIPQVFGEVNDRETRILLTISKHRRHKKYGSIPNGNPLPQEEIEKLARLAEIGPDLDSLLRKNYIKRIDRRYDLKGAMFCSGIFKRPHWDEPAPTVLTNFHNPRYFIHPLADRPFSLRECARLQGFPDDFRIMGPKVDLLSGYRLIGNAVPPPLAAMFAGAVLKAMAGRQTQREMLDEVA